MVKTKAIKKIKLRKWIMKVCKVYVIKTFVLTSNGP